jgi:hypothetical protein
MKKFFDTVGLAADLARGVLLIVIGVGVIVGGTTGVLWL